MFWGLIWQSNVVLIEFIIYHYDVIALDVFILIEYEQIDPGTFLMLSIGPPINAYSWNIIQDLFNLLGLWNCNEIHLQKPLKLLK